MAAELTLHICTTCRRAEPCDGYGLLARAARAEAKRAGVALTLEQSACLSGCGTGLTAMVETAAGMVRLQRVATAAQAALAVAGGERLVDGGEVAGLTVLSRMRWDDP